MLSDLLVLIAVINLGYVISVMIILAFNDATHKLEHLLWPERCEWCNSALEPDNQSQYCNGWCQDQYVEGGQYVC